MPKRKLHEISGADTSNHAVSDKATRLQRQQLEGLLEQGTKALFRSLKIARGFERQKLGRRQKTAKAENNEADFGRLNAEVSALKSLDLASIAEIHLYKTILKIKSIASVPFLPRFVRTIVEKSARLDPASANVQARLFKSNPAQDAMSKALSGIRAFLGFEDKASGRRGRIRAKHYRDTSLGGDTSTTTNGEATKTRDHANTSLGGDIGSAMNVYTEGQSKPVNGSEEDSESPSDTEELARHTELEDRDSDQEEHAMYASRLAASSDEDSSTRNTDDEDIPEERQAPETITDPSSSSHQPSIISKPPKKPPASTSTKTTKSTTFLPSLSMTGYYSGSESAEDLSDLGPQGRKNRMGQQARRALWEKKFGSNANHLKKRVRNRDEGWDVRRGAKMGDERGVRGRGRGRGEVRVGGERGPGGRAPMTSGANSDPVGLKKAKPAGNGPLHPSWEAAKKAKEQKNIAPFQGKKVVFD